MMVRIWKWFLMAEILLGDKSLGRAAQRPDTVSQKVSSLVPQRDLLFIYFFPDEELEMNYLEHLMGLKKVFLFTC